MPGGEAHIEEVEAAIQTYLDGSPRVLVEAASRTGAKNERLRRLLEAKLGEAGKLTIVTHEHDSGLVLERRPLRRDHDYRVAYLDGRVHLKAPLSAVASDSSSSS